MSEFKSMMLCNNKNIFIDWLEDSSFCNIQEKIITLNLLKNDFKINVFIESDLSTERELYFSKIYKHELGNDFETMIFKYSKILPKNLFENFENYEYKKLKNFFNPFYSAKRNIFSNDIYISDIIDNTINNNVYREIPNLYWLYLILNLNDPWRQYGEILLESADNYYQEGIWDYSEVSLEDAKKNIEII